MTTYLESSDVCRLLTIAPSTLRNWIKAGRILPSARTTRGINLFLEGEVVRVQRAQEHQRIARP